MLDPPGLWRGVSHSLSQKGEAWTLKVRYLAQGGGHSPVARKAQQIRVPASCEAQLEWKVAVRQCQ